MLKMTSERKYAIVTGASSGIGWHISRELAVRGYSIIAVSNQPERLINLKLELEQAFQIIVETIECDLSDAAVAKSIFDFCIRKNLNVEVLVNNAGILVQGQFIGIDEADVKSILQLHMITPVLLCRLFGEMMVKARKGYILNVSSISAVMPYPTISLYGPTKSFLRQFTRALSTEMKGTGVNVLCLLPGATATELYNPDKINISLAMKLGVMKKPDEVAKKGVAALFKNRTECIPGMFNKIIMLLIPIVPNRLISFIYRKVKNSNLSSEVA